MNRRLVVVLILGCALTLSGLALPWTYNRIGDHRWLAELIDDDAWVVVVFIVGLAALALSVTMTVLRSPRATVLVPALVGAVTVLAAVVLTPRLDSSWSGMDGTGRQVGGSEPTLLSFGAIGSLLGAMLLLVVALAYARSSRVRP